jgi:hypothetical protein
MPSSFGFGLEFKLGTRRTLYAVPHERLGNWRASDSESKPLTETSTRAGRPLILERLRAASSD